MHIDILNENISQTIDSAIQLLKNDTYYLKHQNLLKSGIENNDIDAILTAQMTLHNMELEAVYRAGHQDCLDYFAHIITLKRE